jgi:aminoglycoside phosphotransferase (APT) family kinase protein
MTNTLHNDEITIDNDIVRHLVDSQFPKYTALSLTRLGATGSTNALFRLGDDFLVRLPRQPGGSSTIDKEQRWLPEIGRHLSVAVPAIVGVGETTTDFGERWSITRWLEGELPEVCNLDDAPESARSLLATDLAAVIASLQAIEVPRAATADPNLRWYRGRSLGEYDQYFHGSVRKCRSITDLDIDLEAAAAVWANALALSGALEAGPDRWYHSDLVAENLLIGECGLVGVLDFGGLAIGDPTIDLHGAWELFDAPAREVFRIRLGVDETEWLRGRAWALAIGLGALAYYWTTMPGRRRDRLAMVRSVLADATDQAT